MYRRFYEFHRGILSAELLFIYCRYKVEIFRVARLKILVVHESPKLSLSLKAPKLALARKLRFKKHHDFLWFSLFISILKNIF